MEKQIVLWWLYMCVMRRRNLSSKAREDHGCTARGMGKQLCSLYAYGQQNTVCLGLD